MKVILTEEVLGLGDPGKIVDVAPGYARNFLVPRKLAAYANEGKVKELEHNKRRLDRKRDRMAAAAQTTVQRLNGQVVNIDAKAGPGGRLFGSVTTPDIAEAIKAQCDIEIDRRKIQLREPIRTIGDHEVEVHLIGDARAVIKVHVADASQPEVAAPVAPTATAEVAAPTEEAPAATETE